MQIGLPERDDRPEALALRALKLGDILVAVPALKALRRGLSEHRLIVATTPWLAPVVELIPGIDVLLPTPRGLDEALPVDPGRIDLAANLHGNGPESRSILHLLQAARTIEFANGDDPDGPRPRWLDGELERERWARLVRSAGFHADADDVSIDRPGTPSLVDDAIVVHVGAFYGSRRWPADRFAEVARALAGHGHPVVFTGGADDRPRALDIAVRASMTETHVLAGRASLADFAGVIARSRLVVTVDTGAAHLASAYGTPSVVIFGPAPPEAWGPPASGPHRVLTHAHLRRGETFAAEPDPALLAVTADEVVAAALSLMR